MTAEYIHLSDIRGVLERLDRDTRTKILRKAAYRASAPTVKAFAAAWTAHPRRRRGRVGRAIGDAQVRRVNATDTGVFVRIGTNYRAGGPAKLWHILERGFRHYGKGGGWAYKSATTARSRRYEAARSEYMREAWRGLREAGLSIAHAKQAYGQIGKEFDSRHPAQAEEARNAWHAKSEKRKRIKTLPAGASRRIGGEWVSRRIMESEMFVLPERMGEKIIEELKRAKLA